MSSKRSSSSGKVDVWESCVDLPFFVANGLMAFLIDSSYEFGRKYESKALTLASARLVCRDLRCAIDARIVEWMKEFHGIIEDLRKVAKTVALFNVRLKDQRDDARRRLASHVIPVMGEAIASAVEDDVSYYRCLTVHIAIDVCTFMCMATKRCQVHGPMGKCCRNVPAKRTTPFSFLTIRNKTQCLYAKEKCVNMECIVPNSSWRSHVDDSITGNTARAMMREVGVYYPYHVSDIWRATRGWGSFEDDESPSFPEEVDLSKLPQRLFLARHPALSSMTSSLQEMLALTDKQTATCCMEAVRKAEQKAERERRAKQRLVQELVEDLDSHMARQSSIPVDSMAELLETCPGMGASLTIAVENMHHARHAMDVEEVRNVLNTISHFLGPVLLLDRASGGGRVGSSEAYDFVSGLYAGTYGTVPSTSSFVLSTYARVSAVLALRFFDHLDEGRLQVEGSRNEGLPVNWALSIGSRKIVFKATFYDSYIGYCDVHRKVLHLVTRTNAEVELPELFPKIVHTQAIGAKREKKQRTRIAAWVMKVFTLLVTDPATRCGALDVLNLTPEQIVRGIDVQRQIAQATNCATDKSIMDMLAA